MSVTVADLVKLPSLRQAKVLGGQGGLDKIVSSISVLESTDPGMLVDGLFPQGEFCGSEIVITGFLNLTEDVEGQCANIRRLAEGGEVGLILYYVGIYLPRVDRRLIELADELDFVLICMPEGQRNLRYGEVLCDVMEYIYRDRIHSSSIVSEILARVSALPPHQRTVSTVLKMLSDWVSASVILCDASFHILNLEAWPRVLEDTVKAGMETRFELPADRESAVCGFLPEARMYRFTVRFNKGSDMELLLIKEGILPDAEVLEQAADLVRLSINIWGEQHGEVAVHELVRAILQDDPLKMRRLADIFHIDVASIHEMWILQGRAGDSGRKLKTRMSEFDELLKHCVHTAVADMYEDCLLLFLSAPFSLKETQCQMESILTQACMADNTVTLTRCRGLGNTTDVRRAYLCHRNHLADALKMYPRRRIYGLGEVEFAGTCRSLIEGGEEALGQCLSVLDSLKTDNEELYLSGTLSTYLLDGEASVTKTAGLLFLHKNTVKYRIGRISQLLGCRPDKMPEGMDVYRAVAVHRLLS